MTNSRLAATITAFLLAFPFASLHAETPTKKPNILWFVVDDMSANFSCYGEKTIQTPHVDRLAEQGTRFANAFVTAPVCSACRSALITGMYQTAIGAHHHRSGRGALKIQLPQEVVPVPAIFQRAGYYTCIGSGLATDTGTAGKKGKRNGSGLGKTDYNFEWDPSIYHSADWSGRKAGQPFFMQVQLAGGKLRGGTDDDAKRLLARAKQEFGDSTDPEAVRLPPYYPRDPVLLRDWAAYLDAVRFTDKHVGSVLARLEKEGILDETLIIFMTDHGISHARGKQFLYDEGTHIPFIVRGPEITAGQVREDLIEHLDMAAVSLAAAGIAVPASMQSRNVFAKDYAPRTAVFAARDRCDETVERLRSVRTDRFLYIRNYYPQRPHLQPNAYKDGKSIVQTLRSLHDSSQLDPLAESLLFSPIRPAEELYEWTTDRWQVTNLAANPEYRSTLDQLRSRLDRWIIDTHDHGPETDAMYDSDMSAYLGKGNPVVERNIALMKQWAKAEIPLASGVLELADKNGDGKLTLDEYLPLDVQAKHHGDEHFSAGDVNGDGFLDAGELVQVLQKKQTWFAVLSEGLLECFARIDANHDCKLDADEYRKVSRMGAHAKQHFNSADKNGDNFLDEMEFTAHIEKPLQALKSMSTNSKAK